MTPSAEDLSGVDLAPDLTSKPDLALPPDLLPLDHDIRDLQDPSRASFVAAGGKVRLTEVIVTVRRDSTNSTVLFVQEPNRPSAYNSILVFVDTMPAPSFTIPAVGDSVTIDGSVAEFARMGMPGSRTNVDPVTAITIHSSNNTLPSVTTVAQSELVYAPTTPGDQHSSPSEKWEGVLIKVDAPSVKSRDANGEFTLDANLKVDDRLFTYTMPYPSDTFTSIAGVLDHDFGTSRILPREASDLAGYVAAPPVLLDLTPASVQVGQGERTPLTITLDRPAAAAGTMVAMASLSSSIAAPVNAIETVAAGMTTKTVEVEGKLQDPTAVGITASLGGVTKTSMVTVVGPITVTAFGPSPLDIAVNGSGILTLTLSRSAPVGGTAITLTPGTADITVPSNVVVPAGVSKVTIRIKGGASATAAAVTLGAAVTANSMNATVNVLAAGVAPTASALVINEFQADPAPDDAATTMIVEGDANCSGTRSDADEFVELINVTAQAINMQNVAVWDQTRFTAGAARFVFPAFTLGPGEAVVVFSGAPGTTPTTSPWCLAVGAGTIGDVAVFGAGSGLDLANAGDSIYVTPNADKTLLIAPTVTYTGGSNDDSSQQRDPEITGTMWKLYKTLAGRPTGWTFSPGRRIDGKSFADFTP